LHTFLTFNFCCIQIKWVYNFVFPFLSEKDDYEKSEFNSWDDEDNDSISGFGGYDSEDWGDYDDDYGDFDDGDYDGFHHDPFGFAYGVDDDENEDWGWGF